MNKYECAGRVPVEELVPASSGRDAANRFLAMYEVLPDTVGSRNVVGQCENTGTPILEGDIYDEDAEGVKVLIETKDGLGEDELDVFAPENIQGMTESPDLVSAATVKAEEQNPDTPADTPAPATAPAPTLRAEVIAG